HTLSVAGGSRHCRSVCTESSQLPISPVATLSIGSRQVAIRLNHQAARTIMKNIPTPKNIDDYIANFPSDVQKTIQKIRTTINKAVHDAHEKISYKMPSFTLKGVYLIYFAAYKNHIGLYPAPRGSEKFKKELSNYEGGKGTVRFPLDEPIPFDLITRIVKFRARENQERTKAKKKTGPRNHTK